jgi:large subunit ribosomal protein L18
MSKKITKNVPYKRKRLGKTNYHKRIALLKSRMPRMVIRRSLSSIMIQIVEFTNDGDRVLAQANSRELQKLGWKYSCKNIPAAYLTGLLVAKKAQEKKIGRVVVDFGMQASTKGGRLYAALKGAVDFGMDIAHSDDNMPDEARLSGAHIADFAKQKKSDSQIYSRQFREGLDYEKIPEQFNMIKDKITKGK